MQIGKQKLSSYRFVGAHPGHQTNGGHLAVDGIQFLNAGESILETFQQIQDIKEVVPRIGYFDLLLSFYS